MRYIGYSEIFNGTMCFRCTHLIQALHKLKIFAINFIILRDKKFYLQEILYKKGGVIMAKIRIVSVPPGAAPEWVRREWVGLEILLAEDVSSNLSLLTSNKPESVECYEVDVKEAVKILRGKRPEAAAWWDENRPLWRNPLLVPRFSFPKENCELIS